MIKSPADRSKASRIRRKIREGLASSEERAWLESYEGSRRAKPTGPPAPPSPPTPPSSPTPPSPPAPPSSPTSQPPPTPAAAQRAAEGNLVPLAPFTAPPPQPAIASVCSIPDCPACRRREPGQICEVTGKRVWPPLSREASQALAKLILNGLGFVIRLLRADKYTVDPTNAEINALALGLRAAQEKYFGALSSIEDVVLLVGTIGSYAHRALTEKPREGGHES